MIDRFVEQRVAQYAAVAPAGRPARFGAQYDGVLGRLREVYELGDPASLFENAGAGFEMEIALDLLSLDLSRCVLLEDTGKNAVTWDTHALNDEQNWHYQLLFERLLSLMEGVDARTTLDGRPLQENLTIVVLSEMGRDPRLNAQLGKHHWTWTSAMLIGAGITGGRSIGGFDEYVTGLPIDMETGELSDGGNRVTAADVGATLLALGDVDPGEFLPDGAPILGIMT
jgi:hypothetical protein